MIEAIYAALGSLLREQRIIDGDTEVKGLVLLGADGVMDSLASMRFINAVCERFQVDIMEDLNLDCMETTDHLAHFILTHTAVSIGRHLILDCDGCPEPLLKDMETVRMVVRQLAEAIGTSVLKEAYHVFSPAGVTGFAIVSASHIAVHTWPEYGYMGVDIFSCRDIQTEAVLDVLHRLLGQVVCRYRFLERTASKVE